MFLNSCKSIALISVYTFDEIVYTFFYTLQLILSPDYYNDILTNQKLLKMKKRIQNTNQFKPSLQ